MNECVCACVCECVCVCVCMHLMVHTRVEQPERAPQNICSSFFRKENEDWLKYTSMYHSKFLKKNSKQIVGVLNPALLSRNSNYMYHVCTWINYDNDIVNLLVAVVIFNVLLCPVWCSPAVMRW